MFSWFSAIPGAPTYKSFCWGKDTGVQLLHKAFKAAFLFLVHSATSEMLPSSDSFRGLLCANVLFLLALTSSGY